MNCFEEITALLTTDLKNLIRRSSDPEGDLDGVLHRLEAVMTQVREQAGKEIALESFLFEELSRNRDASVRWGQRAATAKGQGDEHLAEIAETRQSEHGRLIGALKDRLESAQHTRQALFVQMDGVRAKLEQGRRLLASLAAQRRAGHHGGDSLL